MNFAQRIKEFRAVKGWSQQQLADKLGISKSSVSLWEIGKRSPTMSNLTEIADTLGVTVNYLLGDSSEALSYDSNMNDIAQTIIDKPELKMLFEAAEDARREDVLMCTQILERLRND